jgi:hypothetical protein
VTFSFPTPQAGPLLKTEFITPGGDPVKTPVDGGDGTAAPDGANEFTYSTSATGSLTLTLKVRVAGLGALSPAAQAARNFRFQVVRADGNIEFAIPSEFVVVTNVLGSSAMTWDNANPYGQPVISGDILTAKATFTGLPADYSDFGPKIARLLSNNIPILEQRFEVFYTGVATNHPGGDPAHPNWFHYYKQNAGGGAFGYDPGIGVPSSSSSGAGDSTIKIAHDVYLPGGRYIQTQIINGYLQATGVSAINRYYAHFLGALDHERQHANHEVPAGPLDPDQDDLASTFENTISHTKSDDPYSARGYLTGFPDDYIYSDSEVYAGGPVEEKAIRTADTSHDWANPGTNHKP